MTFKEYYKRNKFTTKNTLRIFGIVLTSIFAVLAIFTDYYGPSLLDTIKKLIIIIILGNGFAFLMLLLPFFSGYAHTRYVDKFFKTIPQKIRDKYGFLIIYKNQNPKYNFLQYEILSSKTEIPIFIELFKKEKNVRINIVNNLSGLDNFQELMLDIQKRYKKDSIYINGFGFYKYVKLKDWKNINESIFDQILADLIEVSIKENIVPIKRNIE